MTASNLLATTQVSHSIEYSSGTVIDSDASAKPVCVVRAVHRYYA